MAGQPGVQAQQQHIVRIDVVCRCTNSPSIPSRPWWLSALAVRIGSCSFSCTWKSCCSLLPWQRCRVSDLPACTLMMFSFSQTVVTSLLPVAVNRMFVFIAGSSMRDQVTVLTPQLQPLYLPPAPAKIKVWPSRREPTHVHTLP